MNRKKVKHFTGFVTLLSAIMTSTLAFSSFVGTWAQDCNSRKNGLVITAAPGSNLHYLKLCFLYGDTPDSNGMCSGIKGKLEPTTIYGDKDFSDIHEDSLVFMGNTFKKCISIKETTYKPYDLSELANKIVGQWKAVSTTINGKEELVSENVNTITVSEFTDDGIYKTGPIRGNYSIEKDTVTIAIEFKGRKDHLYMKVLSITDNELIVSTPKYPKKGAIKSQRVK